MKTRLITGTVYIALLVAFYVLKIFVHDFFFDALIYAFAVIGTFEMTRAMKDKTTKAERVIVMIFSIVCIPACAVCEYFFTYGLHVTSVCFFALSVALISLLVVSHEKTTLENIGTAFLSAVYPVLLLCLLVLINHVPELPALTKYAFDSRLLILFVFVISPFADSFAYLFGRFMRGRFPKKLAPEISPNKTVVGGIGGLVGGMLGAGILYVVYNAIVGSFDKIYIVLPIYLAIGLLSSIATEFGDLVESCIKRKVGLKDMGKIMPGHGGVLDRIDGTLFAGMVVYLCFAVIRLMAHLIL